jgi:hypothetical protein
MARSETPTAVAETWMTGVAAVAGLLLLGRSGGEQAHPSSAWELRLGPAQAMIEVGF